MQAGDIISYLQMCSTEGASLQRGMNEPNFDLGWEHRGVVYVAEVKSVTNRNEERQLRMGLGQVLQYRHQLCEALERDVVGVLVTERKPPAEWIPLCASLGLRLVWPGALDRL